MTPNQFKRFNEYLARLIYAPDTTEAMRKAAKDARKELHRLYGANSNPPRCWRRPGRTRNPAHTSAA